MVKYLHYIRRRFYMLVSQKSNFIYTDMIKFTCLNFEN